MGRSATVLVTLALVWQVIAAFAFSSDGSSLGIECDRNLALTNSPILVTATFTNGGTNTLHGFFFGVQVASGLDLNPVSVKLGAQAITNCSFETGQFGDVYSGFTPVRWRLESPTNFPEANPVPPEGVVRITYTITSATPATFGLPPFDWAAYTGAGANAAFGNSDEGGLQTVSFLLTTNPPVLSIQLSDNDCVIRLEGETGASYLIETTRNLVTWYPLLTNTGSFSFTPVGPPDLGGRFYRGKMLLP